MPCSSGYSDSSYSELKQELDIVTRVACDLAKVFRSRIPDAFKPNKGGDRTNVTTETREWVTEHDAQDKARIKRESLEARRERRIKSALSKLSPKEIKALGIHPNRIKRIG
jgi:hypothetical protein